jgi:hypothetical protein
MPLGSFSSSLPDIMSVLRRKRLVIELGNNPIRLRSHASVVNDVSTPRLLGRLVSRLCPSERIFRRVRLAIDHVGISRMLFPTRRTRGGKRRSEGGGMEWRG